MKITGKRVLKFVMWLVGILAALGIGGLFINGTMTGVIILKWLPLILHQIVGWVIIVSTIVGAIAAALK